MPPYGAILRFGANQCTLAALVLKVGPAASCWIAPKADILGLRSLKANAARITIHLCRVMGRVTAMVLTFTLMVASIFFGLFVAALILSAIETAQQCAEE